MLTTLYLSLLFFPLRTIHGLDTTIIHIVQMGKWRLTEVKGLAQDHTAWQWWINRWNQIYRLHSPTLAVVSLEWQETPAPDVRRSLAEGWPLTLGSIWALSHWSSVLRFRAATFCLDTHYTCVCVCTYVHMFLQDKASAMQGYKIGRKQNKPAI